MIVNMMFAILWFSILGLIYVYFKTRADIDRARKRLYSGLPYTHDCQACGYKELIYVAVDLDYAMERTGNDQG